MDDPGFRIPESGHRRPTGVGRDESATDRTAVASASGSTRPLAVTHDRLLSGSEIFAGSTKEKPGPWPGLSIQTGVRLNSDALLLATTQYQEATDEERQLTSG
jgi:hypothetical protein